MKRSVIILLTALLILLAGCTEPTAELPDPFEADVSAVSDGLSFTAHASLSGGELTLGVSTPDELSGITYTVSDSEMSASYSDLSCVLSPDSLAGSTAPRLLYDALAHVSEARFIESVDGANVFELTLTDGKAKLVFSGGELSELSADFSPYIFTFTHEQ